MQRAGRFSEKTNPGPFFPEKNIQERGNSIVRFALYAHEKTGSCRG